jgi:hypothetical protein
MYINSIFYLNCSLLDNNSLLGVLSPEIYGLEMLSQFQVDENQLSGATRESSCNERPISWYVIFQSNFLSHFYVG